MSYQLDDYKPVMERYAGSEKSDLTSAARRQKKKAEKQR